MHRLAEPLGLLGDFLLLLAAERGKLVVLGADKHGDGGLGSWCQLLHMYDVGDADALPSK